MAELVVTGFWLCMMVALDVRLWWVRRSHTLRATSQRGLLLLLTGTTAAALISCGSPTGTASSAGGVRRDLYVCEGCEAALERDPQKLSSRAEIAAASEPGEPLVLRGRVYQTDGRTPAAGVVVYAYHTNASGRYAGGSGESEWSRRHGRLRAWVRTDGEGRYEFRTIKPAPYPEHTEPAHIHLTVREPQRRPYWIDAVVFAGEYRVDEKYRRAAENRGGSGIVQLTRDADGTWIANRDIILERHPD
jgi:protocatechuate 3,4-dioxygenase beta subunit